MLGPVTSSLLEQIQITGVTVFLTLFLRRRVNQTKWVVTVNLAGVQEEAEVDTKAEEDSKEEEDSLPRRINPTRPNKK